MTSYRAQGKCIRLYGQGIQVNRQDLWQDGKGYGYGYGYWMGKGRDGFRAGRDNRKGISKGQNTAYFA